MFIGFHMQFMNVQYQHKKAYCNNVILILLRNTGTDIIEVNKAKYTVKSLEMKEN